MAEDRGASVKEIKPLFDKEIEGEDMSEFTINCPQCGVLLEASDAHVGLSVACPSCEAPIQVAQPLPEVPPKPETKDCPYCGEEILAKAKKCKHCGEFLDDELRKQRKEHAQISPSASESAKRRPVKEKTEYQSHPSMFRSNPIGFILALVLIVAVGLGLLILLVWWLKCLGTTLIVTNKKTTLRRGILSKHINEVYHSDVRNVQVSQTMFQRMFGVGAIGISSAGQGGVEIRVSGLPAPAKIKDIIDRHRRD